MSEANQKRELISISVGQAGTQVQKQCWDLLRLEHGLDQDGKMVNHDIPGNHIWQVFHELHDGTYSARHVFVDSEPNVIDDCITHSDLKNLFTKEYMVKGTDPTGNVYPMGANTVSKDIHSMVTSAVRRSIEQCDNLNGLNVVASLGGGTGSGYTFKLLGYLYDVSPKTTRLSHNILASSEIQANLLEPYNNVFGIVDHTKLIDVMFCYDNQTLYKLVEEAFGDKPSSIYYREVNHLVALVNTGLSSCSRFQEERATFALDLRAFMTNLVPFANIKTVSPSIVPLHASKSKINSSIYGLTAEAFLNHHEMCKPEDVDLDTGKYISCCLFYRGEFSISEVHNAVYHIRHSFNSPFVKWVPTGLKTASSSRKMIHGAFSNVFMDARRSLLKITNHTVIADFQMKLLQKFAAMYDRKDYVHWYCSEGMEEGQFVDAQENLEAYLKAARSTVADGGEEEEADE